MWQQACLADDGVPRAVEKSPHAALTEANNLRHLLETSGATRTASQQRGVLVGG